MPHELFVGDYAAWSYFQSIDTVENTQFVKKFQKRYGKHRSCGDPIATSYMSVKLFARALEKAGRIDVRAIKLAALGISIKTPEGKVKIDQSNQHLNRFSHIGQIKSDGQFEIVWSSDSAIKPEPFPKYKTLGQWEDFLSELFRTWGNSWANE